MTLIHTLPFHSLAMDVIPLSLDLFPLAVLRSIKAGFTMLETVAVKKKALRGLMSMKQTTVQKRALRVVRKMLIKQKPMMNQAMKKEVKKETKG